MFKHYSEKTEPTVTIEFEGVFLTVPDTLTVAAAVLGHAGKRHIRISSVSGAKRGPYCFMGVCHECLMEINGIPDQQACIIEVKEGMKIRRQTSLPGGGE